MKNEIEEMSEQFDRFWGKNGSTASVIMAEYNRCIVLVPGKEDGRGGWKDGIVISKWGLQKTSFVNGQLGSGATITSEEAVKAFKKKFPKKSFIKEVEEGYNNLFRL